MNKKMNDYIKREDAKNMMRKFRGYYDEDAIAKFEIALGAGYIPPNEDVVEVVRCKDCKHRKKEWYQDKRHKDGGYWLVCCENDAIAERIYGLAQDDDYCSYGERAEE